ncbi:MAG: c-type cytochrome [Burkholderiaceae bacterium]|nr:c-type cytochrome [Burkholderiaceae bacterium]
MCSWVSALLAVTLTAVSLPGLAQQAGRYGIGRAPTADEVAAWDIDLRPDGHGVKKGAGTALQGQKIYDEQCASCHGTFGENNRYMAVAGGVRKDDLRSGRASALKDATAIRTLGTKLNHATTLWDYIFRAMPWTSPQSLSVDQTYAVTAYVLYLNEIVPADFELNEGTLLSLQMPNRNGMTRAHGLGRVDGKPDAQGSSCMKDCVKEVTIASDLPEFARNQGGNIAEQLRALGPVRGIDTARYDAGGRVGADAKARTSHAAPASTSLAASDLLTRNACTACHGMTNKIVGPGFAEIAQKYQGRNDAQSYLSKRIKEGGQGVWGGVPMPPQVGLKDADADEIARWITNGAK